MNTLKIIAGIGLAALVSACAELPQTSRNAPFDQAAAPSVPADANSFASEDIDASGATPHVAPAKMNVQKIRIEVPKTLEVSEANRYLPKGDIVWRGDPPGDRYQQVETIFENAFSQGTKSLRSGAPVLISVQVMRFHALTEKARYTTGGVHSIQFSLTVHDARTGDVIGEPRIVEADLKAFGGQEAIDAEAEGQTQKVRITDHLAAVILQELTLPDGHKNAQLGIIQQMNKF